MDPAYWWSQPLVPGALLPLLLAVVATGVIRLIGGWRRGVLLTAAAIGLAWLATHAAILGLPVLPPRTATEKLFVLGATGLSFGILLDLMLGGRSVPLAAGAALIATGLWWIGQGRLSASGTALDWLRYGLLTAAGILVLLRLERRSRDGIVAPVLLLVATLAVGALALLGAAAATGQLAFALAAALGGFLLWNWPVSRYPFRQAGLLGALLPLIFIAGQLTFYSDVPPAALALLLALFFADLPTSRLMTGHDAVARAARPVVLALIALVPAAAALAVAWWLGGSEDPYSF